MRYAESKYGREGLANMYHLLADFHHKRMECVGGCWLGVCVLRFGLVGGRVERCGLLSANV